MNTVNHYLAVTLHMHETDKCQSADMPTDGPSKFHLQVLQASET